MRILLSLLLLASPALALADMPQTSAPSSGIWEMPLQTIDGEVFDPSTVKGKVVLVVNVASFCGFTPQYSDLQTLWKSMKSRGLIVLAAPCNQFGGQEPGSAAEIKNFCSSKYGITFPMLSKQDVNGEGRSPLYTHLVNSKAGGGKDITWNFEKFLIGRDGQVVGRFGSMVAPSDPSLLAAIEMALARKP